MTMNFTMKVGDVYSLGAAAVVGGHHHRRRPRTDEYTSQDEADGLIKPRMKRSKYSDKASSSLACNALRIVLHHWIAKESVLGWNIDHLTAKLNSLEEQIINDHHRFPQTYDMSFDYPVFAHFFESNISATSNFGTIDERHASRCHIQENPYITTFYERHLIEELKEIDFEWILMIYANFEEPAVNENDDPIASSMIPSHNLIQIVKTLYETYYVPLVTLQQYRSIRKIQHLYREYTRSRAILAACMLSFSNKDDSEQCVVDQLCCWDSIQQWLNIIELTLFNFFLFPMKLAHEYERNMNRMTTRYKASIANNADEIQEEMNYVLETSYSEFCGDDGRYWYEEVDLRLRTVIDSMKWTLLTTLPIPSLPTGFGVVPEIRMVDEKWYGVPQLPDTLIASLSLLNEVNDNIPQFSRVAHNSCLLFSYSLHAVFKYLIPLMNERTDFEMNDDSISNPLFNELDQQNNTLLALLRNRGMYSLRFACSYDDSRRFFEYCQTIIQCQNTSDICYWLPQTLGKKANDIDIRVLELNAKWCVNQYKINKEQSALSVSNEQVFEYIMVTSRYAMNHAMGLLHSKPLTSQWKHVIEAMDKDAVNNVINRRNVLRYELAGLHCMVAEVGRSFLSRVLIDRLKWKSWLAIFKLLVEGVQHKKTFLEQVGADGLGMAHCDDDRSHVLGMQDRLLVTMHCVMKYITRPLLFECTRTRANDCPIEVISKSLPGYRSVRKLLDSLLQQYKVLADGVSGGDLNKWHQIVLMMEVRTLLIESENALSMEVLYSACQKEITPAVCTDSTLVPFFEDVKMIRQTLLSIQMKMYLLDRNQEDSKITKLPNELSILPLSLLCIILIHNFNQVIPSWTNAKWDELNDDNIVKDLTNCEVLQEFLSWWELILDTLYFEREVKGYNSRLVAAGCEGCNESDEMFGNVRAARSEALDLVRKLSGWIGMICIEIYSSVDWEDNPVFHMIQWLRYSNTEMETSTANKLIKAKESFNEAKATMKFLC